MTDKLTEQANKLAEKALTEMMNKAIEDDDIVVIQREGKPAAVIVKYETFQELQDELDRFTAQLDGHHRGPQ
jgi:PHD/YefM family antitoxin component YafN of YafNO toxin-antitoxin module